MGVFIIFYEQTKEPEDLTLSTSLQAELGLLDDTTYTYSHSDHHDDADIILFLLTILLY